jgi:hypothetical protein
MLSNTHGESQILVINFMFQWKKLLYKILKIGTTKILLILNWMFDFEYDGFYV